MYYIVRCVCLPCSAIQFQTLIPWLRTIQTAPGMFHFATKIFRSKTALLRQRAPLASSHPRSPLRTPYDPRETALGRYHPFHGGPGTGTDTRVARSTRVRIRSQPGWRCRGPCSRSSSQVGSEVSRMFSYLVDKAAHVDSRWNRSQMWCRPDSRDRRSRNFLRTV